MKSCLLHELPLEKAIVRTILTISMSNDVTESYKASGVHQTMQIIKQTCKCSMRTVCERAFLSRSRTATQALNNQDAVDTYVQNRIAESTAHKRNVKHWNTQQDGRRANKLIELDALWKMVYFGGFCADAWASYCSQVHDF